jgi:DNA-directed RNA polymerase specialized sigma24 family protein
VLVVGQQLTHAEAAEILGVSESTVSWRMHEVRKMLAPTGRAKLQRRAGRFKNNFAGSQGNPARARLR